MDKCPKCGNEKIENSIYCNNCGYKFEDNKVKTKFHLDSKSSIALKTFIFTFIVCTLSNTLICYFMVKNKAISTTINNHKDVNIVETGLASSVEKVYDSVVVVENFVRDNLYATGTGFVFQTDDNYGYILTNYHVIENGTELRVVFTNNEEVKVDVVGSDEFADVAVLKVDKKYVTCVAITGSSKDIRVGDTAFAVGAPLDAATYSWSVTRGIISGKDRVVEASTYVMEVLQTDTAINSGNSGGPLCNANGEVIGITNMKISSSSVEGMGFAIPIETALEYANHFLNGQPIERPYLGISLYDLSNNFFSTEKGIYINGVEENGPASKAGLAKGDIILKINGKEVPSTSYFKYELYKYKSGDEIEITYKRNGKEHTTKVTLATHDITA